MAQITIQASNVRETSTGVERGVDVDVLVTLDGQQIEGEVTLVPIADGTPGYEAYGMGPDHWVSGELLRRLQSLSDDECTEALRQIESAAAKIAKA